ncbi:hypothetical protein AVEN_262959-1 [Araneus ventricosus]|uniref:Uncharacterized protein n=1 Tax=Araneus ventricosus TaxID=182803 RepID=A0A4Y2DGA3_ARAVE|nr:hypothetical protein AVEN_262959-1 [Araneus ventricosus]
MIWTFWLRSRDLTTRPPLPSGEDNRFPVEKFCPNFDRTYNVAGIPTFIHLGPCVVVETRMARRPEKRVINEPQPPLRVTIEESKEQAQELPKNNTTEDPILRNIIISVPANFQKFIPPIVEKLNTRSYSWNEYGELTEDNEIVRNTNVIDLFSYLMRNVKKVHEPHGFSAFWNGIKEIKIPTRWIGNHKLVQNLEDDMSLYEVQNEYTPESPEKAATPKGKKRKQNSKRKWKEF